MCCAVEFHSRRKLANFTCRRIIKDLTSAAPPTAEYVQLDLHPLPKLNQLLLTINLRSDNVGSRLSELENIRFCEVAMVSAISRAACRN